MSFRTSGRRSREHPSLPSNAADGNHPLTVGAWRSVAPSRGRVLSIALLIAFAASLRLAAVLTIGDTPGLHGDEAYYVETATAVARGHGYPNTVRAPGFSFLIALVFRVFGENVLYVRLAQVAISLVVVIVVYAWIRRRFGHREAFLSALLCAANPTLVHYTHFLWSETLLATLLVAFLWLADLADTSDDFRMSMIAGAVLGAAVLTREIVLYVVPIAALWLVHPRSALTMSRAYKGAILLIVCVGVVAPWTIHNYVERHHVVVVSTLRWYAIAMGNALAQGSWSIDRSRAGAMHRRYFEDPDEIAREDAARKVALREIADAQPLWIAKKVVLTVRGLFAPRGQLARFAEKGWLREEYMEAGRVLAIVDALYFGATCALGILAIWLVPSGREKILVLSTCLVFCCVYVVANAIDRFRVPFLPLLAMYVGPLSCGRFPSLRQARWRIVGAVVTLGVIVALVFTAPGLDAGGTR